MQTMLARTSHPRLKEGSSSRPHFPRTQCCAIHRTLPRRHAIPGPWRTRWASNSNADVRQARLTHSPVRSCSRRRASEPGPLLLGGDGVLPGRILQHIVCAERYCSRICPACPRSPARCISRAQRHCTALLRMGQNGREQNAARFWPMRPKGFGFQKIFVQRTQKDFPNLPKKRPLTLEA